MPADLRKARDLALLDTIDALPRESITQSVWRVTREGRDPLQGAPSASRWCNTTFDVLYTSFERDGALAEIHALLSSQPVFPSKIRSFVHRISVRLSRVLRFSDLAALSGLGVDTARYGERIYNRTQEIADAAYFLNFEGLIAPSARWNCPSLVVFSQHVAPSEIQLDASDPEPIDWAAWRKRRSTSGRS